MNARQKIEENARDLGFKVLEAFVKADIFRLEKRSFSGDLNFYLVEVRYTSANVVHSAVAHGPKEDQEIMRLDHRDNNKANKIISLFRWLAGKNE